MCVVNRSTVPKSFEFNWQREIVNDELTKRGLHGDAIVYKLHDLWTGKDAGTTKKPLKTTIQPNDVLMFRLTK